MDNYTAANFDFAGCLKQLEEVSRKMASMPNGLVMTHATWFRLRQEIDASSPEGEYGKLLPSTYLGIPVWVYNTVKECMDRMMDQSKDERLQLTLDEDIPIDCLFHPWLKQQVEQVSEKMGFSVRGYE